MKLPDLQLKIMWALAANKEQNYSTIGTDFSPRLKQFYITGSSTLNSTFSYYFCVFLIFKVPFLSSMLETELAKELFLSKLTSYYHWA
jgi:hypothetical protein